MTNRNYAFNVFKAILYNSDVLAKFFLDGFTSKGCNFKLITIKCKKFYVDTVS